MKDKLLRITFLYFIFIFIVVAIDNNSYKSDISYSLVSEDIKISMVSDEHVLPGEKVFLNIEGDIDNVKDISLDLVSNRELFTVKVMDIHNKAYFVLPEYSNNVIVSDKYKLDAVKIVYDNDILDIYSVNNRIDGYKNYRDDSYIIIDDRSNDSNQWKDFNGLDLIDNYMDDSAHVYINLYADTSNIVNIMVMLESNNNSYIGYVENLDTRPYISFDEELDVDIYKIHNIIVYYKDGGTSSYSAFSGEDNYLSIKNNEIIVDKIIVVPSSKNIEDVDSATNMTRNSDKSKNVADYLWIVLLILLIVAAVILFYYLKTEDDD